MRISPGIVVGCLIGLAPGPAFATPVPLSSATATFTQPLGGWDPSQMIDGTTSGVNGWAIYQFNQLGGDQTLSATALFTLASPLAPPYSSLTITIYQNYGSSHLLGNFALGYATDASPTLASTETPFTVIGASSVNGTTFGFPATGQILAGGPLPDTDVYTITVLDPGVPITGLFLNAINDPSSPSSVGAPGRQPTNGNFVVNELTANTVVAEPASLFLFGVGLAALGLIRRRTLA
jgi:hypothetical protein